MNCCIKLGFNGYIVPYNLYIRGDAYQISDAVMFIICQEEPTSMDKLTIPLDFIIHDWVYYKNKVLFAPADKVTFNHA